MRVVSVGIASAAAILLSDCATVPPLNEATGSIPIHDIVQRVKCELADTFDERTEDPKLLWLKSWTAKVDLTLAADNQGSITPVGAYIEPLKTVSGVSQQFSFGAGGSVNGEAVRTEIISFSLSLEELKRWRSSQIRAAQHEFPAMDLCNPNNRLDLAGGLGLNEWIDSALSPIELSDLQAGDHPAPGTTAKASTTTPKKADHSQEAGTTKELADAAVTRAQNSAAAAQKSASAADQSYRKAFKSATGSPFRAIEENYFKRKTDSFVTAAHDQATLAQTDARRAGEEAKGAKQLADTIAAGDESQGPKDILKKVQDAETASATLAQDAAAQAKAANQNATLVATRVPDPPIDSISHSVQFFVTATANIAPSWTLVRFHGPTGNLAGFSGIRTHTLNIALGPRGQGDAKYSQEAARVLTNLTIQQLRITQTVP
jgi:hypothetical protein